MVTIKDVEKGQLKQELPSFRIGDTVEVQVRITEGEKERVQTFSGTVIARKGSGLRENFTVRRIVQGEGVERIFPIHSPTLLGVTVVREGHARRAKLYYLRERTGKATRVRARKLGARTNTISRRARRAAVNQEPEQTEDETADGSEESTESS